MGRSRKCAMAVNWLTLSIDVDWEGGCLLFR